MKERPIFGKGIRQCLYWAYAMECIDPHEPSAHQKLLERQMDGDINRFFVPSITLKGWSSLEQYGLATSIRHRVEHDLAYYQRGVIWAKYGDPESPIKEHGVRVIAELCEDQVARRRRLSVPDLVRYAVRTPALDKSWSAYRLSRHYGCSLRTIFYDVGKVLAQMKEVERTALQKLRPTFRDEALI